MKAQCRAFRYLTCVSLISGIPPPSQNLCLHHDRFSQTLSQIIMQVFEEDGVITSGDEQTDVSLLHRC